MVNNGFTIGYLITLLLLGGFEIIDNRVMKQLN